MPQSPRRPRWSEGLLLSPQHLEYQDRYHEARVDQLLRSLLPITWGLVELEVDEAALSRGELSIPRLQAILPDGTPIAWSPAGGRAPPRRSLSDQDPKVGARISVHLALPEQRPGDLDMHREGDQGSPRRFVLREDHSLDIPSERTRGPLEVLEPAPIILLGDERADGATTLRIAALRRRPDGGLELDDSYFPPSLRLHAAQGLVRRLRRLLAAASERRRLLQSECRQRAGRIDYRSSELDRHLLIHALGRLVPRLRSLLEGTPTHPRHAHELLAELVGELASFLPDGDPATLPLYNHADASDSFRRLFTLAARLIDLPMNDEVLTIPLFARGARLFAAEAFDNKLRSAREVVLALHSDADLQRRAEALPELLKVASGGRIDAIIRSNSRGAPARLLSEPPSSIPTEAGAVYLSLDTRDTHWQEVIYQRDLAVHLSSPIDTRGLSVRILALPANGADHGLATQSRDACA